MINLIEARIFEDLCTVNLFDENYDLCLDINLLQADVFEQLEMLEDSFVLHPQNGYCMEFLRIRPEFGWII